MSVFFFYFSLQWLLQDTFELVNVQIFHSSRISTVRNLDTYFYEAKSTSSFFDKRWIKVFLLYPRPIGVLPSRVVSRVCTPRGIRATLYQACMPLVSWVTCAVQAGPRQHRALVYLSHVYFFFFFFFFVKKSSRHVLRVSPTASYLPIPALYYSPISRILVCLSIATYT